MLDAFWVAQAVVAFIVTGVFALHVYRAWKYDQGHPTDPLSEAAMVIATGFVIISAANVLTAWATALSPDWTQARDFGGTTVRGVLLIVAIYLLLTRPLRNRP